MSDLSICVKQHLKDPKSVLHSVKESVSSKNLKQKYPIRQEFVAKLSSKSLSTNGFLQTVLSKSVLQKCQGSVSCQSAPQKCQVRAPYTSVK